ncbi:MAG: CbtA family protein [Rhodospirillales bacterium]|nr:CbtA family protein [Rhodospirillales bacterium]
MRRALIAALVAAVVGCAVVTAAQQAVVVPLILKAETFEDAAPKAEPQAHSHAPGTPADHHHDADAWSPADGIERIAFTALANLGVSLGFALLLVAGFTLAGREVDGQKGLLWGAAGFACFTLAPTLGLPPELPGSVAAAVGPRQVWWFGTALATGVGLALIVFGRHVALKILGVAAIVIPHVVGAPHPPAGEAGGVPPELAAQFAVLSLAVAALFWGVLGWVSGTVWRKAS